MSSLSAFSLGVSPYFAITAESLRQRYVTAITRVDTGGVEPPTLGAQGGHSQAMRFINRWHPWLDEKLLEPKYDGFAAYSGLPSNRPTPIKDFHAIALMRAVDELLLEEYEGLIEAEVTTVIPESPPTA